MQKITEIPPIEKPDGTSGAYFTKFTERERIDRERQMLRRGFSLDLIMRLCRLSDP
jgi:hypothetical protein